MKLLVSGSRSITNQDVLFEALDKSGYLATVTSVLCGDAQGVDFLAREWAMSLGLPVRVYEADWKKHGNRAGPVRNAVMVAEAEVVLAVWDGLSPGTFDAVQKARAQGLPLYVHRVGETQDKSARCAFCPLREERPVAPRGNRKGKILIVGEAPGPMEARSGTAFTGKAGDGLNRYLKQAGIEEEVFITNVVRCFPKDALGKVRRPTQEETFCCQSSILKDIREMQPKVIVAMGGSAVKFFGGPLTISNARKIPFTWPTQETKAADVFPFSLEDFPEPIPVVATFHPLSVLYDKARKNEPIIIADLIRAKDMLSGVVRYTDYTLVDTNESLEKYVTLIEEGRPTFITVDIESTGLNYWKDKLLGIAIGYGEARAVFIPWDHNGCPKDDSWREVVRGRLNSLFKKIPVSNHNLKFDMKFLAHNGIHVLKPYFDTMLASWWSDADTMTHGLEDCAAVYLGIHGHKGEMAKAMQDAGGYRAKWNPHAEMVPIETLSRYACADGDTTWELTRFFERRLAELKNGVEFDRFIMAQILPMLDMEMKGVQVDMQTLSRGTIEYRESLQEFTRWFESTPFHASWMGRSEGKPFNPDSPAQMAEMLYDIMGIQPHQQAVETKIGKDGKQRTTRSTATEFRDSYLIDTAVKLDAEPHRKEWWGLIREFLEKYNDRQKKSRILKGYLESLPEWMDAEGKIHTTYNIGCTASGRSSAKDPSLHTMPPRTLVKESFIPSHPMGLILNADYAQVELRILACLSDDPILVKSLSEGMDIHRVFASRLYRIPMEKVTKDQRRVAKTIVFGLIYGRGASAIAVDNQISLGEAQTLISSFFDEFPGVKKYIDEAQQYSSKVGLCMNALSRRKRPLPGLYGNREEQSKALRVAVNSPIQGTASEATADSLVRVWWRMRDAAMESHLFGYTHDSITASVYPGELLLLLRMIREEMQEAPSRMWEIILLPLLVDFEVGVNWGKMGHLVVVDDRTIRVTGEPDAVLPVDLVISSWENVAGTEVVSGEEETSLVVTFK